MVEVLVFFFFFFLLFLLLLFLFFFNDTATTEIYTLSLHDALPIYLVSAAEHFDSNTFVKDVYHSTTYECIDVEAESLTGKQQINFSGMSDRKSTRLNSSHTVISYAVFCLKKKKKKKKKRRREEKEKTKRHDNEQEPK